MVLEFSIADEEAATPYMTEYDIEIAPVIIQTICAEAWTVSTTV